MKRMRGSQSIWLMLALSLMLVSALAACTTTGGATESAGEFSLTGVQWEWESMTVQGQEEVVVPMPSQYTIIFNEDGTLGGKNDCNVYGGTYTTENGGIQITLGQSTMAFCGEASLDMQFAESLNMVVAGGPDGTGKLALESAGGERRMIFRNGGAPPES